MIIRLDTGETTIPGVWWFPAVMIIRLSQPSLAGVRAGAEG